jgi:hypothetical protein
VNFLLASTFTDSVAWLTSDEQKAVKTIASSFKRIHRNEVSYHTTLRG